MPDLAACIFVAFVASIIIALMEFGFTMQGWDEPAVYSPELIYDNTKMNWFGCWFFFVLIRLVSPLFTIIGLIMVPILYIIDFIKWLFTVGRKDD